MVPEFLIRIMSNVTWTPFFRSRAITQHVATNYAGKRAETYFYHTIAKSFIFAAFVAAGFKYSTNQYNRKVEDYYYQLSIANQEEAHKRLTNPDYVPVYRVPNLVTGKFEEVEYI